MLGNECTFEVFSLLGHQNLAAIIIQLAVLFVLFILCLAFKNKQPLKSRGLIPLVVVTLHIIIVVRLIFESNFFVTKEWQQKYWCFVIYYITRPVQFTAYFLITLHEFRFLVIINLNNMKKLFFLQGNKPKITWKLKFLKLATKRWFLGTLLLSFLILNELISFLVQAGHGFSCSNLAASRVPSVVAAVIPACCAVIAVLELIFDMWQNRNLKGNLYKYFVVHDVFKYRLEIYSIIIFGLGQSLLTALRKVMDSTTNYSIFTVFFYLFVSASSVFPLVLTIIWEIRKRLASKSDSEKNQMDEKNAFFILLNDPTGKELFVDFAKMEWSVENIMILDDIHKYKSLFKTKKTPRASLSSNAIGDLEKAKQIAQSIYDTYLNTGNATFEVNIDRGTCLEVLKDIQNDAITDHLFDQVEDVVMVNLIDTYLRFKASSAYRMYARAQQAKTELIKKSGIV